MTHEFASFVLGAACGAVLAMAFVAWRLGKRGAQQHGAAPDER